MDAEAQELDAGDQAPRPGQAEAGLDHQGRQDVRQDLAHQDLAPGHADGLRILDEFLVRHVQRHRAAGARDRRHEDQADRDHKQQAAGAGDRHAEQDEDALRESQDHVHRAHQQPVEATTALARYQADRGAEDHGDQRCSGRHPEKAAAARERAREHVAAEIVGSEQAAAIRRLERRPDKVVDAERRKMRSGHGRHDGERQQGETDLTAPHGQRAAQQPHDGVQAPGFAGCRNGLAHQDTLAHRPAALISGLTASISSSAARLTSMYTAA